MLPNDILTVGDGIYQIDLGGTSATLVETNEGPVLIDAGWIMESGSNPKKPWGTWLPD